MMRLWIGYWILRLAMRVLPNGTRDVLEYQINEAIDMGTNPDRRAEWLSLKASAMEGRDG